MFLISAAQKKFLYNIVKILLQCSKNEKQVISVTEIITMRKNVKYI